MDVKAYLARIGLASDGDGIPPANLEVLKAIKLSHMQSIPFENLDLVQNKLISIDVESIANKIIQQGRGGYCYEHNTLLMEALRAIGFVVTPMLSRVSWRKTTLQGLNHIILVVKVPDETTDFFVDPAFGGMGPVCPLRLDTEEPQESFRLRNGENNHKILECYLKDSDTWAAMLSFRNEETVLPDIAMSNWWACTHKQAFWKTCLFASILVGDSHHHILNGEYCVRPHDGPTVRTKVTSYEQLIELLSNVFHIHVHFQTPPTPSIEIHHSDDTIPNTPTPASQTSASLLPVSCTDSDAFRFSCEHFLNIRM